MIASWVTVYRAFLLLAAMLGVFLLSQALVHRGKRRVTPLLVLSVGALIYVGVKLAVSFVRGTPTVFVVTRFNVLGSGLATVGFFFLAIEYAGLEAELSKRTAALVLIEPLAANLLVWVNVEWFWVPVGRDASTVSGYAWEVTSIAVANQLYMNLLLLVALVVLVRFGIQSAEAFNAQVGSLVAGAVAPLLANLAYYAGYVPFNPTPIAFVFSGLVIAWAILWGGFLDLVPVSRGAVVDNLDAGILTVDSDHRLLDVNEYGRRLFGLEDRSFVGRHVDEVFADRPLLREMYWSSTDIEPGQEFEMKFDGRYYDIDVTTLTEVEGTVLGRSIIVRDVTGRTLREQELERKNEQLERFASVVSHDIRNPLNVIQSRVELARTSGDYEAQFDSIETNANRIEDILEDVLIMTRGGTVEDTESVDVSVLAERAWRHVDTNEATLETGREFSVDGDPGRLVQLFENVFRNAVEHGRQDATIRVGALTDDADDVRGFYISDDGPGIPDDERGAVFEDGYTTSEDGTGLGLSIVAEIVAAHGWHIDVTESASGGARFDVMWRSGSSPVVPQDVAE